TSSNPFSFLLLLPLLRSPSFVFVALLPFTLICETLLLILGYIPLPIILSVVFLPTSRSYSYPPASITPPLCLCRTLPVHSHQINATSTFSRLLLPNPTPSNFFSSSSLHTCRSNLTNPNSCIAVPERHQHHPHEQKVYLLTPHNPNSFATFQNRHLPPHHHCLLPCG
ncbi:hypothetical protein BC829DRAFT_490430, partial [Chytridium lagenaria]